MNKEDQPKQNQGRMVFLVVGLLLGVGLTFCGVKIRHKYLWYMKGHALNYVRHACSEYKNNSSDVVSKRTWPSTLEDFPKKLVNNPYRPHVPQSAFKDMVYVSNGKEFIAFFPSYSDSQRVVIGHSHQIIDDIQMSTAGAMARADKIRNANKALELTP